MIPRHIVAKEMGRRVSRGEYERILTAYVDHVIRVSSNSKGKHTGATRVVRVLHKECPKYLRKKA